MSASKCSSPRPQRDVWAIVLLAAGVIGCRQTRTDQVSATTEAIGPSAPSTQASSARTSSASPAQTAKPKPRASSFYEAKKLLRKLYDPVMTTTLYAGCPISKWTVDYQRCCYRPGKRARLEWEHVVPASAFGRHFEAWKRGHPRCVNKRGKSFRGRRCARRASARFRSMEADMHNLYPAIGAVNGARGHLPLGLVQGEARSPEQGSFGSCDIEMDGEQLEPRPAVRGEVARAYLYMDGTYPDFGIIEPAVRPLLLRWHKADPPDDWERKRNAYIAAIQGRTNPWIK